MRKGLIAFAGAVFAAIAFYPILASLFATPAVEGLRTGDTPTTRALDMLAEVWPIVAVIVVIAAVLSWQQLTGFRFRQGVFRKGRRRPR